MAVSCLCPSHPSLRRELFKHPLPPLSSRLLPPSSPLPHPSSLSSVSSPPLSLSFSLSPPLSHSTSSLRPLCSYTYLSQFYHQSSISQFYPSSSISYSPVLGACPSQKGVSKKGLLRLQPGAISAFGSFDIVKNTRSLFGERPYFEYRGRKKGFNFVPFRPLSNMKVSSMSARKPPSIPLAPLPKGGKVKVALCQLSVTENKTENIENAKKKIEEAAAGGAKLIVLPEMWNCPYSNDSFPVYAEEIGSGLDSSPSTKMLAEAAKNADVTIVGGSIPERRDGELFNTCCVFGPTGELKGKFSKMHLFDIDIPGKISFKESLTLTPGSGPLVVDTDVGRIGIGICYDIRFPELAMLYSARGVHLICYPGAFNTTTGPLHWELLQKCRAVDNQVFVATCSPARSITATYKAWGHSTAVGPFGEILGTTEHEEAIVFAEMDFSEIETRRQNMPLDTQRRGDIYQLADILRE